MGSEAEYRTKAVRLAALARYETDPGVKQELRRLAASYLRLAAQARANSRTDVVYETPGAMQNQPMQAQQSHLKKDEDE
jgi:hypothetical protein